MKEKDEGSTGVVWYRILFCLPNLSILSDILVTLNILFPLIGDRSIKFYHYFWREIKNKYPGIYSFYPHACKLTSQGNPSQPYIWSNLSNKTHLGLSTVWTKDIWHTSELLKSFYQSFKDVQTGICRHAQRKCCLSLILVFLVSLTEYENILRKCELSPHWKPTFPTLVRTQFTLFNEAWVQHNLYTEIISVWLLKYLS